MKNLKTKLFALAMAAPMAVSAAGTAVFADEGDPTPVTGKELKIQKVLVAPKSAANPGLDYSFKGELVSVNDVAATDAEQTALNFDSTINYDNKVTAVDAKDNTVTYTYSTNNVLPTNFPHAGVYKYDVTEVEPVTNPFAEDELKNLDYDKTEYRVYVSVTNTGSDGLTVSDIQYTKSGETDSSKHPMEGDALTLSFTNTYTVKTDAEHPEKDGLYLKHQVSGELADKSKEFEYTITLTAPAGQDLEGVKVDGKNYTAGMKVTLKHGEEVAIAGAPVGTSYTITPTKDAKYDIAAPVVKAYKEGEEAAVPEYTVTSDEVKAVTGIISENKDEVTYTHTISDTINTGNFINNMPFIALIAVALGGFVAYIAAKRRNA